MEMDRSLYPANWEAIAQAVKEDANWECVECGRKCRRPGESELNFLERIRIGPIGDCPVVDSYLEAPRRYVLTVAHLDHIPANCDRSNLRALCAPCHLRYVGGEHENP